MILEKFEQIRIIQFYLISFSRVSRQELSFAWWKSVNKINRRSPVAKFPRKIRLTGITFGVQVVRSASRWSRRCRIESTNSAVWHGSWKYGCTAKEVCSSSSTSLRPGSHDFLWIRCWHFRWNLRQGVHDERVPSSQKIVLRVNRSGEDHRRRL